MEKLISKSSRVNSKRFIDVLTPLALHTMSSEMGRRCITKEISVHNNRKLRENKLGKSQQVFSVSVKFSVYGACHLLFSINSERDSKYRELYVMCDPTKSLKVT